MAGLWYVIFFGHGPLMTTVDPEFLRERFEELRTEHRDLDDVIARMSEAVYVDQLQLRRLKKRKLALKDQMARIESLLIPDLDA